MPEDKNNNGVATATETVNANVNVDAEAQVPTEVELKVNDDEKLKATLPTFDKERNTIKARFFPHIIKGKKKRAFLATDLAKLSEDKEEAIGLAAKFIGADIVLGWINQKYRKTCLDWTQETVESCGHFDMADFSDRVQIGKINRVTSEELRDKLSVILTKLRGISKSDTSEETQQVRISLYEEMQSVLIDLEDRKKGKKGSAEGAKADASYDGEQGVEIPTGAAESSDEADPAS